MEINKKQITLKNSETLCYLDQGEASKDVLLLVHGNVSSGVHFLPVMDGFSHSYRVIAPDLRGFGDSSYNTAIEKMEDFSDDLAEFMDILNIPKAYVLGWSNGGAVAMKLAAKYPQKVKKLVLLESASFKGYPMFKKDEKFQPILTELHTKKEELAQDPVQVLPALTALEKKDSNFMKQLWTMGIYNVKLPQEPWFSLFIDESMKQRNLVDVNWALLNFNVSHDHNGVRQGDGSIDSIQCPVLSVYSKKDLLVTENMFSETVKALHNVDTVIFDEYSHSPITDDPETVVKTVINFLRK